MLARVRYRDEQARRGKERKKRMNRQLTELEAKVWELAWKGLRYEQIAEKLHITRTSVRRRLRSARRMLRAYVVC